MFELRRLSQFKFNIPIVKRWFSLKLNFRTWLFFVTSLFIIGIGFYLLNQTKGAKAAWFDSAYQYRQRIPITNGGSALTNYQIGFTLNTSALASAGKMQSDCDDILLVSEDGTVLPHWRETGAVACSLDTASRIWTKIPSIPTSGMNIYIYYGNLSASNSEAPKNIFEFFDDFSSALSPALWTGNTSNFQVSGGYLIGSTTTYRIKSSVSFTGDYRAITRHNAVTQPTNGYQPLGFYASTSNAYGLLIHPTNAWYTRNDASWVYQGASSMNFAQWTRQEVKMVGTAGSASVVGETSGSDSATDTNSGLSSEPLTLGLRYDDNTYSGQAYNAQWDFVAVTKAVSTEPVAGAPTTEEVNSGPILDYKFDEGNGTTAYDSSSSGYNGTLTSGPVWQTEDQCISGKCLYFDGTNDYVDTGKDLSWSASDSFTFSLWIKPLSLNNQTVFGKGTTSNWEYSMKVSGSSPYFTYWNTDGIGELSLGSSIAWTLNQWNHIEVTYDGNSATGYMYLDGKQVGTDTVSGTFQNRTNNLYIGMGYYNSGAAGTFPGFIDEFKIFNYARSADQVKTDYIQGASGKGSATVLGAGDQSYLSNGLMGYWKMDESSWVGANAVLDSSGNMHSGTAVGDATVAAGKFGNGGTFDGTGDYVNTGESFPIQEALTVATWVKPTNGCINPSQGCGILGNSNYSGSGGNGWHMGWYTTTFNFLIENASLNQTYNLSVPTSSYFTANVWTHVAGTFDGKNMYIYVNGVQVAGPLAAIAPSTTTYTLRLGSDPQGGWTTPRFSGGLDEVRVYNRALTSREVSQLYNYAPGPVAYYNLDENAGSTANDRSGNGNSGTLATGTSAPTWSAGQYGGSLRFDGTSDYVDAGTASILAPKQITVAMWINPEVFPTGSTYDEPLRKEGSYHMSFEGPSAGICGSGMNVGIKLPTEILVCIPNSNFSLGTWTHVAFTADGTKVKGYVNGIESGTGTSYSGDIAETAGNKLFLGTYGTSGAPTLGRFFRGMIDDVRIYNYPRTQKQIISDMNGGHPSVGSPVGSPAVYYKLDEGYGTVINNNGNAGIGLTGTFGSGTSAPTWTNDGKFGKGLSFDGTNDYARSILSGTDLSQVTISFWEKPDTTPAGQIGVFQWANLLGTGAPFILIARDTNPNLRFYVDANYRFDYVSPNNEWAFITVTLDAGNLWTFYINGVAKGTYQDDSTHFYQNFSPYVYLGNGYNGYFDGTIDEVKIYNYALTADEVKADYNQGRSVVLGAGNTGLGGTTPSNSSSREYCIPGDATSCTAPVAEWNFDEGVGGTANDTSGNGYVGNLGTGNSAPKWSPGVKGSALQFDGTNDYVNTADIDITGNVTLSTWIKTTSTATQMIIRKTSAYELIIANTANCSAASVNGSVAVAIGDGTTWGCSSGDIGFAAGTTSVADDKWHYVVGTYSDASNTINIYVDGVLQTSKTDATRSLGLNNNIVTFGQTDSNTYPFKGIMDQVRIYNYVRTPAQVVWEYSKGASVAQYKMDECEGTTIYNSAPTFDDSAPGNNGELTIGASGSQTTVGTCSTSGAWYNGATGKHGASMSFDGTDDYINAGTGAIFNMSSDLSIAAWIKPNSLGQGGFGRIVQKDEGTGGYLLYLSSTDTNALVFGTNNLTSSIRKSNMITLGEWQHVAVTLNGTTATLYKNGVAEYSDTVTAPTGSSGARFVIGNRHLADRTFDGLIDDVRVYNYALTPQQMKVLYNNGAVSFE